MAAITAPASFAKIRAQMASVSSVINTFPVFGTRDVPLKFSKARTAVSYYAPYGYYWRDGPTNVPVDVTGFKLSQFVGLAFR